jgi:DeoR/GlpR family transcriptional regulator of sugar metabolism
MHNSELTTGGHLAQLCLQELRANKVFMGARAVEVERGLFLDEVAEVTNFRECIKAANETILVVDHSKLGQVGTAALGPITLVDRIVIDQPLSPEICVRLRELGIELILA